MGSTTSVSTQTAATYTGHLALGTYTEMRLLQRRLRKRGVFTYCSYLGNDFEGDPLWALDSCTIKYATQWERRHFVGPEPQFTSVDAICASQSFRQTM